MKKASSSTTMLAKDTRCDVIKRFQSKSSREGARVRKGKMFLQQAISESSLPFRKAVGYVQCFVNRITLFVTLFA